jgi:hypothetical protein
MEAPLGPARPEDFPAKPQWVTVLNQEEKGSDVKLAVHMVNDAHLGLYEVAVVISNDSDLAEAFRIVKGERRLKVGLLCPADRPTTSLKRYSSFVRSIDTSALAASQFPETMQDGKGWFHKPSNW